MPAALAKFATLKRMGTVHGLSDLVATTGPTAGRLPASVCVIRIAFTIIHCSCGFGVWPKMLKHKLVRRWCATCEWKSTEASKATQTEPRSEEGRLFAMLGAIRSEVGPLWRLTLWRLGLLWFAALQYTVHAVLRGSTARARLR